MEIGATKGTSLQLQTSGASGVNVRGAQMITDGMAPGFLWNFSTGYLK